MHAAQHVLVFSADSEPVRLSLDVLPFLLFPSVLAGAAALCVINEIIARQSLANIRVDLLLTIPMIAVIAVIVGAIGSRPSFGAGRLPAVGLLLAGGVSGLWFAHEMFDVSGRSARGTKAWHEGNRLYWEETIRCKENFTLRFGPSEKTDHPCRGHFLVVSRSGDSYPYSRLLLNDEGLLYAFFTQDGGTEDIAFLDNAIPLERGKDDAMRGTLRNGQEMKHAELRSTGIGGCEATVETESITSGLTLERVQVPACPALQETPVTDLGAWSDLYDLPHSAAKSLIHLWLWRSDDAMFGLLVSASGTSGTNIRFNYAKRLWTNGGASSMKVLSVDGEETDERYEVRIDGDTATITGPDLSGFAQRRLTKRRLLTHPKIALVPLYDAQRFRLYFHSVLRLVYVPWIVP